MDNKPIIIGSRAFFDGIEGFNPKDTDVMIIVERGNGYEYMRQMSTPSKCEFSVVRRPVAEHIEWSLNGKCPAMSIGKFLVPEAAEALGFTFDMLPQIKGAIDKLDKKHAYERIIYKAYLANGQMEMTDAQRHQAYESYISARTPSDRNG
ncbi:MAG: hypothetical protein BHV69_09600 [Bacteroidales bacterium 52_46]|nr:MAG: hypothetical protein BHV69_09600 [Bacteroidales bacterium 52_46]